MSAGDAQGQKGGSGDKNGRCGSRQGGTTQDFRASPGSLLSGWGTTSYMYWIYFYLRKSRFIIINLQLGNCIM